MHKPRSILYRSFIRVNTARFPGPRIYHDKSPLPKYYVYYFEIIRHFKQFYTSFENRKRRELSNCRVNLWMKQIDALKNILILQGFYIFTEEQYSIWPKTQFSVSCTESSNFFVFLCLIVYMFVHNSMAAHSLNLIFYIVETYWNI